MKTWALLVGAASLTLSGCWTVSETAFPETSLTAAPNGKSVRLKLSGFVTGVYNYKPVEGHEYMDVQDAASAERQAPGQYDADAGVAWFLRKTASGELVNRAVVALKRNGYVIDAKKPQYLIDVKFTGPELPEHDVLRQIGFFACTLFTAEKSELSWLGRLTMTDAETGKEVLVKDFKQDYNVTTWGPIPIFSPAFNDKISMSACNSWALTALTDRIIAEATAFIADKAK